MTCIVQNCLTPPPPWYSGNETSFNIASLVSVHIIACEILGGNSIKDVRHWRADWRDERARLLFCRIKIADCSSWSCIGRLKSCCVWRTSLRAAASSETAVRTDSLMDGDSLQSDSDGARKMETIVLHCWLSSCAWDLLAAFPTHWIIKLISLVRVATNIVRIVLWTVQAGNAQGNKEKTSLDFNYFKPCLDLIQL